MIRLPTPLLLPALFATWLAPTQSAAFEPKKILEIDHAIETAIADGKTPGGVLWLERTSQSYRKAYGRMSLEPEVVATRIDAIYDAASLTKIVATSPAVMLLMERGLLALDERVATYLDGFDNRGKGSITVRQLLTHTSGLRPVLPNMIMVDGVSTDWVGYDTAIEIAKAEETQSRPGSEFVYSDINFILLGEIVQQVAGEKLENFTRNEIFQPLGMLDTGYLPPARLKERIAPTKWLDGNMQRGTANNPICRKTGGVHGHAGMFTTAPDLARFCRMILNGGELEGVRLLKPETVALMTSTQTPEHMETRRGLGWDIDSSYSSQRGNLFPIGGFGHTGFTGSSIWIDTQSGTFVIFMSNRIHPNGGGNVVPLRRQIGTLAAQLVGY